MHRLPLRNLPNFWSRVNYYDVGCCCHSNCLFCYWLKNLWQVADQLFFVPIHHCDECYTLSHDNHLLTEVIHMSNEVIDAVVELIRAAAEILKAYNRSKSDR